MRMWTLLLLAAALLTLGGTAFAVPSLGGPTGIVVMPTALVAPADEWEVAIAHRSIEIASISMYGGGSSTEDESIWSFDGLKGVSSDAELFVLYQRETGLGDADVWEYGGKYVLSENLFPRTGFLSGTKVAAGASLGRWANAPGFSEDLLDISFLRGYLVATKQLIPAETGDWSWGGTSGTRVVGTGGLMYLSLDAGDFGDDNLIRPFVGVEFIGQSGLTLAGEYRMKDSDLDTKAVFSGLLRKPWGDAMALEVGITNASPIGLGMDDQTMFIRMTYALPTAAYQ